VKNFKCASFEKKVKFFCEILGGGSVGGLKLFSTARVKPSAKQKDLSRHSESSKQHSSLATDVVPLAIGQKVNIAGKTVSVREVLGDGEEAFVFLVQDSKGSFFALKAFNRPGDLKENRMVLDKMRTYLGDDSVVGIVGVSEARGHLLLEYVKGRELSEFLIDPNLSPQVKMRAQILFEELQRKARRAREIEPVDINVFVRDKDSSLVVIDPY